MGMNAEILAIGPYNNDVIDALEHDAHRYEGTPTGTTIVTQVIVCPGSTTSRELAKACGIDAWNFAKHQLLHRRHRRLHKSIPAHMRWRKEQETDKKGKTRVEWIHLAAPSEGGSFLVL
ncbi:MAG: hypothetical protein GY822_28690 [Deltaproteobacteria bacterium]|nr:hypothetical protein [Deltaproteobacteria bacterium]